MEEMRLQKYLAMCGVASRRAAEEIILQGRVKINGEKCTVLGTKVADGDVVSLDGEEIKLEEKKYYIMLNKPTGYMTTVRDEEGRPTVMDLITDISKRVYPVGRLDCNTEGLLLMSNAYFIHTVERLHAHPLFSSLISDVLYRETDELRRKCFEIFGLGECSDEMLKRYSVINKKYWEKLVNKK